MSARHRAPAVDRRWPVTLFDVVVACAIVVLLSIAGVAVGRDSGQAEQSRPCAPTSTAALSVDFPPECPTLSASGACRPRGCG